MRRLSPGDPTHTRTMWSGGRLTSLVSPCISRTVRTVLLCFGTDAFLSVQVDVGDNSFERQDQFEAGGNQGTTQRNWSTTTIATGRVYYQRQEYNEVVPVAPSSSVATHATANTGGGSLAKQLLYSWLVLLHTFPLMGTSFANSHDWAAH